MSVPLRAACYSFGTLGARSLQSAVAYRNRPLCGTRKRFFAASSQSVLLNKKCVPCEPDRGALGFMGLCEAMDRSKAESMLASDVSCTNFICTSKDMHSVVSLMGGQSGIDALHAESSPCVKPSINLGFRQRDGSLLRTRVIT